MDLVQRLQGISGWLSISEADLLERLAQDQVVLEIGSFLGRSTIAMVEAAKKVICVDFFAHAFCGSYERDATGRVIPPVEKPNTRDIFERNVKPWRHKIEVHEMNSLDAVKLDWEPVGLLFIDGGHDTATVLSDCGFLRWVIMGGFVAFHDSSWKSVSRAIKQVMVNNPEWKEQRSLCANMVVFQRVQLWVEDKEGGG